MVIQECNTELMAAPKGIQENNSKQVEQDISKSSEFLVLLD